MSNGNAEPAPRYAAGSLHDVLNGLPLRQEIRDVLAGEKCKEACLLSWLEDLESNNVAGCEATAKQYGLDTHVRKFTSESWLLLPQMT